MVLNHQQHYFLKTQKTAQQFFCIKETKMLQNADKKERVIFDDGGFMPLDLHLQLQFIDNEDGFDAEYCFKLACVFIRNYEEHCAKDEDERLLYKKHFNYYAVAKVLSSAKNRIPSFYNYVVFNKVESEKNNNINKRAFNWLMLNAVKENYSMYILEQFNALLKKDNDNLVWKGFENWIKSKQIILKNGKRAFKFFDDTEAPLIVV